MAQWTGAVPLFGACAVPRRLNLITMYGHAEAHPLE